MKYTPAALALSSFALLALVLPGTPAQAQSAPWSVEDFKATYRAKVGIARGETRLEMRRVEDNSFEVESWTELRGLVSLFKRGSIYEYARFDYVDGEILTRKFERRDDISGEDRNVRVDYDWDAGTAMVSYQDDTFSVPVEPGVSNTLVMQVELMQALSTDQQPPWLDVVGHKGRLRFDIRYEGPDELSIEKQARTLYRYSHSRQESGIRTTFWAAPERDHLPLKASIVKDDKVKGQLTLVGRLPNRARSAD